MNDESGESDGKELKLPEQQASICDSVRMKSETIENVSAREDESMEDYSDEDGGDLYHKQQGSDIFFLPSNSLLCFVFVTAIHSANKYRLAKQ